MCADLVSRIESLEMQNRRLCNQSKLLAAGLICCMAILALGAREPLTVRAEKFVLVDSLGRERGSFDTTREGPVLSLFDTKGRTLARLAEISSETTDDPNWESGHSASLALGRNGRSQILMDVDDHEAKMHLKNPPNPNQALIVVRQQSSSFMLEGNRYKVNLDIGWGSEDLRFLFANKSEPLRGQARLGFTDFGPAFSLMASGRVASLVASYEGYASVSAFGPDGKARAQMMTTRYGPRIDLSDQGHTLWEVPSSPEKQP